VRASRSRDAKRTQSRRRRADDTLTGSVAHALSYLPQGQLLPDRVWARRHRWIVGLLWFHVAALTGFSLLRGFGLAHSCLEGLLLAGPAVLASTEKAGRRLRTISASIGLIASSSLLVHIWGGVIEAHFHFFVIIPILILYQEWSPFLAALGYVVVHHGVLGAVDASSVYNHPNAIAHPWRWALIHGAFVLAASAASIVSWRANEQGLREPLTGLPGRAYFLHRVSRALERLKRRDSTVAVLFLDLDRFKLLNDTLGHPVGDQILVEAAQRLTGTVRRDDTVARFGGDEFGILCEGIASEHEATVIADRIIQTLARPFSVADSQVFTGASIGIAFTNSAEIPPEGLIADADAAMYRAKARRGDRYVVFDEGMRTEDEERLATETALRRALERDELRLVYQPIVSAASGRVCGVEALLRWQHPERGVVPPVEFISVAEQTGLIVPMGEWVLAEACRQASRWWGTRTGSTAPYVSVNLSARQFSQPDLVEMIARVLEETALDPAQLALEVTESVVMEEVDSPVETLIALKSLGVRILLDDFGTGYSSLSYLNHFPIDTLKVDRSFVKRIGTESEEGAILAAVLRMAEALGMTVVAEGVETDAQLTHLRLLGYDFAQGFLFSPPRSADELERLLRVSAVPDLARTA
jgi:diguanylate cyclase (GGDEF)-like protein